MSRSFALAATAAMLWVAGVFVAPATAGGGCHRDRPTEGGGRVVDLQYNCMNPAVLRTTAGETISFINRDEVTHNVVGASFFEEVRPGATLEQRFETPGTFPYACNLHPSMVGAIVVGAGVAPNAVSVASRRTPSDRFPLGLLLGALGGGALTLGVRRLRSPA